MKKNYIIILALLLIVTGCTKKSTLEDLQYNNWEEDVPNYINVDSSYAEPDNPSNSDIWIYLSFNENSIEQEWTNISSLHASFQKVMFGTPIGTPIYRTVTFNNGKAIFEPDGTANNTTYNFQFYMTFDNGRTTSWSPIYQMTTPPF
tara:strand:+ start:1952 stop:2392 length:441 start_codon:yes stop_codon:yes gene_type:complete